MKRLFIILTVAISVGLSGCELLDKEPLSQISEENYFKNETDLQMFTNPLYSSILNLNFSQQSDHNVHMTLSDVLIGGNRRVVPNSGGGWDWTDLRRINTLLAKVDQCEDQAAAIRYSALARFFRAMFYFDKIKRFGDVPWYETDLSPSDESLYKARDSRELVMSKMIEDIDYAIANLPAARSVYRVNRWAALALKAQFCLYEGTFRKYHGGSNADYFLELSATAAKTLIDGGVYRLYSTGNPDDDYVTLFSQDNANADEYILAINYDFGLNVRHSVTAYTLQESQGRPSYTKKFINTYLMKDGTPFTQQTGWQTMTFTDEVKDRDPRLSQSIRTPGFAWFDGVLLPLQFKYTVDGYQPIKFTQDPTSPAHSGQSVDRVGYSWNDLPVFRYAETLLNYAEAKAELGTLTQADIDLSINIIRERVGMPGLDMARANANPDPYLLSAETGYTNVSGANQGVILEIRRERAIELVQEGFRIDDLVRWKAGYCIDQPLLGIYFPGPGEYDLTGNGSPDLLLYARGAAKPADILGVEMYEIDVDIFLSEGTSGNVFYHRNIARAGFNEGRDYFYPIPINERSLNPNLAQNPGWMDGLNF